MSSFPPNPYKNPPAAASSKPTAPTRYPLKLGLKLGREDLGGVLDVPNNFKTFLLADGEPKVVITPDVSLTGYTILTINREDATLSALLVDGLRKHPNVKFAGWKQRNPLDPRFDLWYRLNYEEIAKEDKDVDGKIKTGEEVLEEVCRSYWRELEELKGKIMREWELRRMADAEQRGQGEGKRK